MGDSSNLNKSRGAPLGNQNATVKHGGAGAVKAIQKGTDFRGLAATQEQTVRNELADSGRVYLVEKNAVRLQVAADLYYAATLKAAESGDQARADEYIKTYGWLASAALRAWAQHRGEDKRDDTRAAAQVIEHYRKGGDNGNEHS